MRRCPYCGRRHWVAPNWMVEILLWVALGFAGLGVITIYRLFN